jgi:hypothetical protein
MLQNGIPGSPNFGANWTPLTRNVIVTLFVLYVAQLLSGGLAVDLFAWHGFGSQFRPWQIVTSFLLGSGGPFWVVIGWLGLYFLLAPVDQFLGRRGFLQALGTSWVTAVAVTAVLLATGLVSAGAPFMGYGPLITALTALFGFSMPNAQFLFMYVIPVRAVWLAWGTGLLSFLYLLASRDLSSSLAFFGWGGAWLWMTVGSGALRRLALRWKKSRIERKLSRFEVIEGGRTEPGTKPRSQPAASSPSKRGRDPGDWVN